MCWRRRIATVFCVFDRKSKKNKKNLSKNFLYLSKTLIFAVGKFNSKTY